jgi:hypothetical protein
MVKQCGLAVFHLHVTVLSTTTVSGPFPRSQAAVFCLPVALGNALSNTLSAVPVDARIAKLWPWSAVSQRGFEMTHKEIVQTIEPHACIEKADSGYLVRKHPEGRVIGTGRDGSKAWESARMNLFKENIYAALAEIPAATK